MSADAALRPSLGHIAAAERTSHGAQLAAGALSVCALWFLFRPYPGVRGDASLYLSKALAEVSGGPLAQDFLFAKDGQFGFSLFPALARTVTAAFGMSDAAMVLVVAGLLLWIAAMAAVASHWAKGRALWAMLACTALAPPAYSYWFGFAEPHATPRIFAEAGVLAAMAMLLGGRRWAALAFLLTAAAMHPVMALCGFGVFALMLFHEDRRWLLGAAAAGLLAVAAGALGAPVLERLFTPMDALWREVVERRSDVVFPTRWPAEEWARAGLQVGTLLLAATVAGARTRLLLGAVAATAALGLAAALLLGDLVGSLLVIQAQPWRAIWLAAALAPACFVFCALHFWRGGTQGRLTLAALALAWIGAPAPLLVGPAMGLALLTQAMALNGRALALKPIVIRAIAGCCVLMLAGFLLGEVRGLMANFAARPNELPLRWADLLAAKTPQLLLAAAAVWLALRPPSPRSALAPVGAAALAAAALLQWDGRSPDQIALDRREGRAELAALLSASPGPVYWIGARTHPWFWADRASWFSMPQGAGVVFSRPLALTWGERHGLLAAIGLEPALDDAAQSAVSVAYLTEARARRVCALPGGPAWIIAAQQRVTPTGAGLVTAVWTPPAPDHAYAPEGDKVLWSATRAYALIDCAGVRAASARPLRPAASPSSRPPPAPAR